MKNKIFVRLVGGYGNQLFIYAFGLALSEKTGKELIIDNISGFGSPGDEYKSLYALDGLNIKHRLIAQSMFKYVVANKYFWYIARKLRISYVETYPIKYMDISKVKTPFFDRQKFRPGADASNFIEAQDIADTLLHILHSNPNIVFDEVNLSPRNKSIDFG